MRKLIATLCTAFLSAVILASPAAASDILIGRMGSLKNPIATPNTIAVAEGFDLYVKIINEAGGVNGQQIKVVFADDEFNPDLVLKRANELIQQSKVVALVNAQGTVGTMGLIKDGILKRSSIALVGPITGAPEVLTGENIFPLRSSHEDEVIGLARQMRNVNQKRVAYLYYNTGQGPVFAPTFEKIMKDNGREFVGNASFAIDPAKQAALVRDAVEKLKALKPDAVFVFAVGPTLAMSMQAIYDDMGPGVIRYTFSVNDWEKLLKTVGTPVAQGVVISQAVPYPYSASRRIVLEYQKALQKYAPQSKLSFASLEGYMTAKVLVEALRHSGTNPTSAKVLNALENLGRYDLGDYVIDYAWPQHGVEPSIDVTIIGSHGTLMK